MRRISTVLRLAAEHNLRSEYVEGKTLTPSDIRKHQYSCNAICTLPWELPKLGVSESEATRAWRFYQQKFGTPESPTEAMKGVLGDQHQNFRYQCLHAAALLAKDMGL